MLVIWTSNRFENLALYHPQTYIHSKLYSQEDHLCMCVGMPQHADMPRLSLDLVSASSSATTTTSSGR